jgi:putative pyruvate formate lyase activating enzyme
MCSQVKNSFDENGIMKSGVIIRHLILPQMSSDSIKILEWIKGELPEDTLVSLMAQYTPYNDLSKYPEISRRITKREYGRVVDKMLQLDIKGYIQSLSSSDKVYIPEWDLI